MERGGRSGASYGKGRTFWCLIKALGCSLLQVFDKQGQRSFSFAQENVIGLWQVFNGGGHIWSTYHNALAVGFAPFDDPPQRIFLYEHRPCENDVGPFNVTRRQPSDIQVNQASFP